MYILFYSPGSAAMAPHAVLEEIGAAHRLVRIDLQAGEHRQPDYLELNPNGRVPTLIDGSQVLFESAAICMHLADRHPEAGLAPAVGTAERGRYYQWMTFLTNTVQEALMAYFHPDYYHDDPAQHAAVKATAERKVGVLWERLDAALEEDPYLLGERFSAADIYLQMLARWSRNHARPATSWSSLQRTIELVRARPAVQRMMAAQELL